MNRLIHFCGDVMIATALLFACFVLHGILKEPWHLPRDMHLPAPADIAKD